MRNKLLKREFVIGVIVFTIGFLIAWREYRYLSLEPYDVSFAWSPDGRYLAFTCRRRQPDREWDFSQRYMGPYSGRDSSRWHELCIVDTESGKKRRLTRNTHNDGGPTWSPDGRHIAYMSREMRQYTDVRLLTLNDLTNTLLIAGSGSMGRPRWSPVGQRLAFAATHDNNHPYGDLYFLDVDTKETKRLTYMGWMHKFAWSPDGNHIVFTQGEYEQIDLFMVSLETETIAQLTCNGGSKSSPVWSPDNQHIAFTAGSRLSQIYIINVSTRKSILFSNDATSLYQFPVWSPDGKSLAYIRDSYGNNRRSFLEIRTLNLGGSMRSYEIATCSVLDLQWSPDGKYLALNQCADWNRDGWNEFKILLFDVEQSVLKPLYTTFPWRIGAQTLPNVANP